MYRIGTNIIWLIAAIHLSLTQPYQSPRRLQNTPLPSQTQNCTMPANSNSTNVMLVGSCPGQVFFLQVGIGTPSQNVYLILDSSQQFMQVLLNQTNQTGFLINESSTAQLTGQFAYIQLGNGQLIPSELGSDIVTLNSNINTTSDMFFADTAVPNLYPLVISGVVGVGIGKQYQNILQIAYGIGQISSPDYTLSLSLNSQSYLYYNQLPSSIIDNSIFIKSSSHKHYSLTIIGFAINGKDYTAKSPTQALLASGDSYFYLNSKTYNQAVNKYFSNCVQTVQGPSCNCSNLANWPVFSFMFVGAQVYIPGESYVSYLRDGSCTYGFGYIQNENEEMILGSSFFVNYNVTLKPESKQIGLQGNMSLVQVVNFQYFIALSYLFLVVAIGMAVWGGVLLWYLRVVQKQKPTRTIQFSISDRFIQTE